MAQDKTVTCGTCGIKHSDNEAYLAHVCSVSGYAPTDGKHFGSSFLNVQKAALKRGGKLSKKAEAEIDKDLDEVKSKDVDFKISRQKSDKIAKVKTDRIRTK